MSIFPAAPEPQSKLGYYRLLSPTASVRVSPLCLGAMNIGDEWVQFMGSMNKAEAMKLLDAFYKNGGNFIDTAFNYQNGQSEQWIGDWMAEKKNRDEIVLATKYSTALFNLQSEGHVNANKAGNSRKTLVTSVEGSLKRLQTNYIDLLYIHWWDYTTSIEELMQSLNHLVTSGKVLYLGVSDTPAWVVSRANQYARDHGLAQFCVYQGEWSIANRDFEREILPMCKFENMGLAIWGSMGGGRFKTEEQIKAQQDAQKTGGDVGRSMGFKGDQTPTEKAVIKVLDELAKKKGSTITGIALSYVMQKAPYVFPIIGGRKVEHLEENIAALSKVRLSKEEIKQLEDASPIDLGFPHNFIGNKLGSNSLVNMVAKYEWVEDPQPILPNIK